VLEAQVQTVDEVIVDITPEGRGLDKVRTYRAASKLGKRIKFRVHHGLSPTTERETRYRLNDGGRQLSEEDRQRVRRERLWNLLRFRNDLNERLTYEAIARLTGYSVSWISRLDEEFLASNSSTSGEAVKRNLNRKKTPELVGKAKALLAAGTSIKDIARELGVHENSIRNWFKEPGPHSGAKDPPAPKSAASGNSLTTSRRSQSIEPPVVPSDVDFDEDGLVDKALEHCGTNKSEKSEWQSAGRHLLAERLKNCPDDEREILKSAARANVEFRAAADAAEQRLKELLGGSEEAA
jgi:transposase-like protein